MAKAKFVAALAAAVIATVGFTGSVQADTRRDDTGDRGQSFEAHLEHFPNQDLVRGEASAVRTATTNNLTYHNGPIMGGTVTVRPIYWGPSWANSAFVGDKATGLATFYSQYRGSNYAGIQTQYGQTNGTKTSKIITVAASFTDTSAASSVTTDVLNKVVSTIGFANLNTSDYYPVYTDIARGTNGFCAWHSAGAVTQNGVTKSIKFAFFFNLDGDAGCDPKDPRVVYSQGTESLVNVTSHELAEALTDPQLNAWYDRSGYENGDKCAWKFNPANADGSVLLTPTASYAWKLQGEWDNATSACKW